MGTHANKLKKIAKLKKEIGNLEQVCHRCIKIKIKQDFLENNKFYKICNICRKKKLEKLHENYDKYSVGWKLYRQKQINQLGVEEYLKRNSEQQLRYRKNNPETQKKINYNKLFNTKTKYSYYKRTAQQKGINFKLEFDDCEKYFKSNCYYCGAKPITLNGIDRKKNNEVYELSNCVACCKECNYMKNSLDDNIFILKAQHITTYLNYALHERLIPEIFNNYKGCDYSNYKNRASKKNIKFELSEIEFKDICNKCCIYCGKKNTEIHHNGIDRVDQNEGYIMNNCVCSCGDCNYMKKNYNKITFINKMFYIYLHNIEKIILKQIGYISGIGTSILKNTFIKMTKEEKKEIFLNYKIKKRNELVKKYNDPKYIGL